MKRQQKSERRSLDTPADVRCAAMDLLARREHSRLEITRKLRTSVANAATLDKVLDRLVGEGLLSDERFCEAFIRARAVRGRGPRLIGMELRERGVAEDIVNRYLDSDACIWLDSLVNLIARKYGPVPDSVPSAVARQQRFLQQRGFTYEQIRQALDRLAETRSMVC